MRVSGPLIVNDARLALLAALGGAGIAWLAEDDVAGELAGGQLRAVLEACSPRRQGFYLYHPGHHPGTALKALSDFLAGPGSATADR